MASTQLLKRRVRSISNTKQITKAMELVAAAKLRKVQTSAAAARIYSDAAIGVLRRLSKSPEAVRNPFFTPPASSGRLYIIFTSDRGLAGAYNSNVFNAAARSFAEDQKNRINPLVIAFGRKGARHFSRGSNIELIGAYENIPDDPDINLFAPALETITSGVDEARFGMASLIFTEPVSTMVTQVRNLQLVPAIQNSESEVGDEEQTAVVYELEPDGQIVLDAALRLYFESALWRARIEAAAAEHAMRMVSMGNANRNAGDLIDALTLELNATRQAHITQEVAEIIGGAEALT
ncbi:ATP synthase F1 subunit gamma [Candidatus Saccharibacteria bacterium RIFCSPHIGHO2_12_FULL_49_19]|nr:MAG: ATP synthase F1 subunit gamma [Candidatus Saccharibacteria bacterium RIFCSPHIGHO2_01_FULL_49_21]OGL37072.1 MAG: ATP synthase F1 subunit gamma [Candidatus Saccharibacteria bacterium RIFCSPHIGHO2_12_FULL_49_19]OGL37704.1 MAG: ATP synthase F1 subunit gamma [Candidatus Saccharibacteria bacterium RIFCSPLOWO2_01_FULL_49_22]